MSSTAPARREPRRPPPPATRRSSRARDVLRRDRRRVDVGERLVDLVDHQHEQRERPQRHGEQRVEHVEARRRRRPTRASTPSAKNSMLAAAYPRAGPTKPARAVADEAGVVGGQRDPRDRQRDDDVDAVQKPVHEPSVSDGSGWRSTSTNRYDGRGHRTTPRTGAAAAPSRAAAAPSGWPPRPRPGRTASASRRSAGRRPRR